MKMANLTRVMMTGVILGAVVIGAVAQQAPAPSPATTPAPPARSPAGADISWAFAATNGALPAEPPTTVNSVPGSTKTYLRSQIDDLNNPPDWFPNEHPPAPSIVVKGHDGALACGACHLMSGLGHPESSDLAGLPAEYLRRTMMDFKSGARLEVNRMNTISKAMSDEEIKQASDWFAALKQTPFTQVKEVSTVPKTFVGGGRMRYASPEGGMEPLGKRIITLPQDQSRVTKRDPHSGFIAYVPIGSIKKGEALVRKGGNGRTVACALCHGESLKGLGNVPGLAGRHPSYMARQLYMFKDGRRNGGDAQLMKKPVAQLTDDDILNIVAYLASLDPTK
jgi:cytochrome c553